MAEKPFPETEEIHKHGIISIEKDMSLGTFKGDLGVQIAKDGRLWICVDGIALLRFRPFPKKDQ